MRWRGTPNSAREEGQDRFSASLIAEALPDIWQSNPDEGPELLVNLQQLSRGALAEMRALLMELRSATLTEASMEDLLRQHAGCLSLVPLTPVRFAVPENPGLDLEFRVDGDRVAALTVQAGGVTMAAYSPVE